MGWTAAMLGMASLGIMQAPCDLAAALADRADASCQRAAAWDALGREVRYVEVERIAPARSAY